MTRHRARPSFTVEVKRTRNTPIIPQDESDRHRVAAEALWKGTTLAEMTAKADSLDEVFAPAPAAAPGPAAKAVLPERRVLPSLIPAPEAPAPVAREEPAFEPVVRRRRAPVTRPRMLTLVDADPAEPEDALVLAAPAAQPEPPVPQAGDEASGAQRPSRPYAARSRAALRPGERWKRRLPRVLW